MDINNSLSSHIKINKSVTAGAGNIGADASAEASCIRSASYSEHNKMLRLAQGQVIKGQIIDHRYNEVKIMVEPGHQVITARLADEISLSNGQYASFIVTENASDGLVLKLIPAPAFASDSIVLKALTAAGITINDRSKALVCELLSQRMPVDKQTIQKLAKLSAANREASPLCLVLMYKNNIPINTKNLQQFEAYLNGTHQLLHKIKDITHNISKIIDTAVDSVPSFNTAAAEGGSYEADTVTQSNSHSLIPDMNIQQDKTIQDNAGILPNQALAPNNNENITLRNVLIINNKLIDIYISGIDTDAKPQAEKISIHESSANLQAEPSRQIKRSNFRDIKLTDIMQDKDIDVLLKYMADAPDTEGIKGKIAGKTASVYETLTYIKNALHTLDQRQISKLLTSEVYSELLEKAFFKKWTITPEDVSKKDSVDNFYRQLESDLKKINNLSEAAGKTNDKVQLQKPVDNLQDNLQFMKDLNNAFAFLQLPVEFKDRCMHSDLYVLTRKRAVNDKSQSLSIHLHLETANIGCLNIDLQLMNNKINTVFHPDNKDAVMIIKEHLPELISSLQTKGYEVKAAVEEDPEQGSLFKKLIEQGSGDNSIVRYTFDIRT